MPTPPGTRWERRARLQTLFGAANALIGVVICGLALAPPFGPGLVYVTTGVVFASFGALGIWVGRRFEVAARSGRPALVADADGLFFAAVPGGRGGRRVAWSDISDIVELRPEDLTPRGRRTFEAVTRVLGYEMQLKVGLARAGALAVNGGLWLKLHYRYSRSLLARSLTRPERTIVEALPVDADAREALVHALRLLRDDPATRRRFAASTSEFLVRSADNDGTPRFVARAAG